MKSKVLIGLCSLLLLTSCTQGKIMKTTALDNKHQIGVTKSIIEYGYNISIAINYPVTGFNLLDETIEKFVNVQLQDFKDEISTKQNDETDNGLRSELNIDYESFIVNDDIISIKLEVFTSFVGDAHPMTVIYTYNFDATNNKFIDLNDIFKDKYLDKISKITRDYFKKDNTYKEYINYGEFLTNTEPKAENYKKYTLNHESITFYFDRYRILPGVCGEPKVTIRFDVLKDYLKIKGKDLYVGYQGKEIVPVIKKRVIDITKPMVALTFDDGPEGQNTIDVLDLLQKYNAVATFFVIGNKLKGNEDTIRRMVAEGCEIGNHSWSHRQLTTLSPEQLRYQLDSTQEAVYKVTNKYPVFVRPTWGYVNPNLETYANMPLILWSVDSRDWEIRNTSRIAKQVINNTKDGDIIILHDIHKFSIEATELILNALTNRGFQFVTVSELMQYNNVKIESGKVYYRVER